jgi:hypothetical protein
MKLLVGLVAAALMLAAVTTALADIDEGEFPPPGGQETIVYVWTGTAWVDITTFPARIHDCEAFHLGDAESYYCNGEYVNEATGEVEVGPWKFDVEASVAQYLEARLSKNALAWYVKKPYKLIGVDEIDEDYLADSIDIEVKSNGDVRIDFDSFGPLVSTTDPTETIESYWWLGQATMPPGPAGNWWTGDFPFAIPEDPEHPRLNFKLWNRIHTGKCTSACLYEDTGALYFVLEEQKPWVVIKQDLQTIERPDP